MISTMLSRSKYTFFAYAKNEKKDSSSIDISVMSEEGRLAFFINIYNALIIHGQERLRVTCLGCILLLYVGQKWYFEPFSNIEN